MRYARKRRWYIQSVSNPNWNVVGEGVCTRFDIPEECKITLKKLEEELGDRPEDLKYGYY